MKKFYLLLLTVLCAAINSNAQVNLYSFSQSTGAYTAITGGTVIVSATDPLPGGLDSACMDDFTYAEYALPFSFYAGSGMQTSFRVNSNGWLGFGAGVATNSTAPISSTLAFNTIISPFALDMMGLGSTSGTVTSGSNTITAVANTSLCIIGAPINGSGIPVGTTITGFTANSITISANATATTAGTFLSWCTGEIRTNTLGTAPNRTFVIQFSGLAQYSTGTTSAGLSSGINYQIRLFEGGGITGNQTISVVYGAAQHPGTAATGQVGLRGSVNTDFNNRTTTTNWSATTAGGANNSTVTWGAAINPASGLTFTWTPPPACAVPADQPTSLVLTPTAGSINGSFTAAASTPSGYLVIRTATNTPPATPADGTTYVPGTSALGGTIIASGAATSFTNNGLTPGTTYYYWVYSYNNTACTGGPVYRSAAPLTASTTTLACTVTGTKTVGPTGNYASLTAALADINLNGLGSPVILELQSAYLSAVETFPVTVGLLPCVSAVNTLTIRPETGATGLAITSANATATIDLNGANYVTFDGRPGGLGTTTQLSIINTNTAGAAIRFINDASSNTVTYCDVQGQNTSNTSSTATNSGVINFSGTSTGALLGNDNNTISFCNVHGAGASFPAIGISATGNVTTTVSYNDNNTITNCNIYDYFIATTASTGIKLDAGNSAWTIANNSLYQTASRTYTTAATHRGFWITPNTANLTPQASGFVITGNFIGGSAANAGGTAYTMLGSIANVFNGMDISVGLGTATSVQNNTVANIAVTTTSTANPNFVGIGVANGHVNIGTTTGNTVGSGTGTGSIIINQTTSSGGTVYGIRLSGGTSTTMAANNNTVGSFTINGSTATISDNFIGIGAVGGTTISSVTINGNTVGSTSTANSINQTSTGASAVSLTGIAVTTGPTGNPVSISNNTIANMNSNCISTGVVKGINATLGVLTVNGNTIRNLSTQSISTGVGAGSAITGISITSASAGHSISGNQVHSLALTSVSTTLAIQITGIFYSGATTGTNTISRNLIHSFDVTAVNPATTITGIDIGGGTSMFANNMIRLGITPAGTSITTALTVRGITIGTTSTNNINFNSIYIGGTGVGTNANNTFAFTRSATSGTLDVRNNIFVNNRSNTTTGGIHYAVKLAAATTVFPVLDYNVYQYTGTGGIFGNNGTTDFATYTPGWLAGDVNSAAGNPQYINPTGTAATVDLHIHPTNPTPVEGTGVNIAAVTDDYDGQARAGLTPVDIGADAGNFILADVFAPAISYTVLPNICVTGDRTLSGVIITDATGVPTTGTLRPRIYYRKNAGAWFSQGGTLTSGTGTNGTWSFDIVALDMGGVVIGDVISYYVIAQDLAVPANIGSNPGGAVATDVNNVTTAPAVPNTYIIAAALNGTYTVGAGGNFTTLTAAVNAYNIACLTGPVIFSLTDATYPAETFPITINANANASAVNTLTIKPATGVNAGISGSSATGLIVLNGADYITINGSNSNTLNTICPVSAASRNLTLTNTNTGTTSAVVWLQWLFVGATPKSAQNNSVINCNIVGNSNTTTLFGIGSGSTTIATTTLGYLNNNNSFINNNISKTQYGIFSMGQSAVDKNSGNIINQNLVNTASPDNVGVGGILTGYENNLTISGNNISGIIRTASPDAIGIGAGFTASGFSITSPGTNECTNVTITQNTIGSIVNSGTFSAVGIALGTAATGTSLIANNMISGVSSNATSPDFAAGIVLGGGAAQTNIYNNTVAMQGTIPGATAATQVSACLGVTAATTSLIDIRNNIFSNTQAGNAGATLRFAAIGLRYASPYTGLVSNNNDLYSAGAGPGTYTIGVTGGLTGTNRVTLANWQTETGQDAASKNVLPVFVSATDLHLQTSPLGTNWCLNSSGANVPAVTNDIDCQLRSNPPDIGADEFTPLGDAVATPSSQTICSGDAINTIVLTGTAASFNWTRDNTVTVTGIAASGTGNISGALTNTTNAPVTVTFTVIPVDAGGCFGPSITATVIVNPTNTIALSSGPGTDAQTLCINTAITNITYSTTNATGATFAGLPAGVTGNWAANVVTISGTPTASGTFNYTVTLTGGCGTVTATGTITVTPDNTVLLTSGPGTDAQTLCINTAITDITYATTGATGATITGLPSGVSGTWAANVVTISGTPTTAGVFNYLVTLTGGCGTITANGSITVSADNTVTLTSAPGTDAQTVCINTAITDITYSTTGATGATFAGLPAGVTGVWAVNVVTISGAPSAPGTFSYTVTLTGGCAVVTATGSITVSADNTVTLTSLPGTDAQTVCENTAITDITYSTTGATGATFAGLPSGVTGVWAGNVVTISGIPTAPGTFNYTVTLTGGCGAITATGTISVTAANSIMLTSAPGTDAQTVCINTPVTNITYATTGATGATVTGLPAGVTGVWAADVVTISGTPTTTAGSPFTYTITLTGGCGTVTTTGTITVTNPPVVNAPTVTQPTIPSPTGTIVVNATGGPTLEYRLNAGAYQLSNTFTGLAPGTSYNIFVRLQNSTGCEVAYSGNPVVLNSVNSRITDVLVGASPFQDSMWTINLANYTLIRHLGPTLAGFTITGMNGIATNPLTGEHFMIAKVSAGGRRLVKVNVQTGVCTLVGNLTDNFSTLAFKPNGELYGVTGNGAAVPETMYRIDTLNGAATFYRTLGNGADGEVIAYNPDDNFFYHWSGNGTVVWEKFATAVDPIQPLTTPVNGEVFGALYAGAGKMWVSSISSDIRLWDIPSQTTSGVLMNTPDDLRGLVRESCASSLTAGGPTAICSGNSVLLTVNGGTGNYQWYLNGSPIGGANSSTYSAATAGLYNARYTDGCGVTDSVTLGITVSVSPTPDAVATPASQSICSGSAIATIAITGSVGGTTFNWTRDNTVSVTGIAASGSGDISGTLTNTTNAPVTVTFTITPTAGTCTGTPITATVIVNPVPDVNQPANQAVCNNTATSPVNFTGSVPGTIFSWTNSDPSIGLAASGTGDIASFTATNPTTSPVVATITVTPGFAATTATATFNYTGTLQTWTVPAGVTSVNFNAVGAQGGSVTVSCAATGGLGARMQGDFAVTPGEVISILVGQQGLTNGSDAGGGGGTFVVRGAATPLLVAGGGGGATNNINNCGANRNGVNATITTSGTASGNGLVAGGTAGNGGGASGGSGGGGGGFFTDGVAGTGLPGNNGKSYLNGGAGGNGNNNDFGGYGGGGAGWFTGGNGGGGGGYSGGGTSGSQPFTGGGGGGSYNAGTNQVNTAAAGTGNGQVIITYAAGPACTGTPKIFTITVNPTPSATITYTGSPYCSNAGTATVTRTGTAGGTYSSTAGLSLNTSTGDVNLGASTPGTYTVTYTIPAAGGCATFTTTTSITITALPVATISYAGSPYCSNAGTATVTLSGTAGGTYSSTAGLTINATTGDVNLGTSTPGTYTVTYTFAASGGCPAVTATTTITITQLPAATITYAGSPYCSNAGTASVTQTGTTGGTYSAAPAGLTINATTGDVTLGTTTPGTYAVTYTLAASGGCPAVTATTSITVTQLPAATIAYTGSPYCQNGGTATVTRTGTAGGTYSSTAGLTLNATTGAVTLGTSTPGTYLVTYTIAAAGGCPAVTATASITITATPSATISYAGSPYCSSDLTAPVTRTGTAGGTYSSTAGLTINAATGTVTPNTSTPGTYTVTYSIPAGGGCAAFSTTTTITITLAPNAIIFYAGTPYCQNAGTATVTRTGTAGGTYSAAPAGLTLNAATGAVTLGTSTPGTYTVTYTIPASGGCGIYITTTTITINTAPTATIAYTGSPYCANAGTANVTRTGTAGGTYSSTTGLTINATTGAVTLGTSTPGTYTVTYTIAASGGCPTFTTTATITITALPAATISYAGTPYCQNAGTATVTRTGTAGGTYSSTAGLSINATTGDVNLGASTPGTYTVTYTMAAGGGCPVVTTNTTITINALPVATISYAGNPYCQNAGTASVTRTGAAGGTYSSTAGLTINATTGTVTLGTSTPGTYTVTYTIAASGGCPAVTATTTITVSSLSADPAAATASPSVLCGPGTVTLSVTGGSLGTGATWRWYTSSCGGTLVGTGATLNVTVSATTTYFVRAEGTCNTTACASVTVTVNVQPAITIAASPRTLLQPGQTTTLTATVTPAGPTNTIVWYRNGIVVPGATGLTLVVGIDELGLYTARTTTPAGCTALSTGLLIGELISNNLFITPNPNHGQFKVRYYAGAPLGFRHLVMFAENGQKVYDQIFGMTAPYTSMDVNAIHLAKGFYIVMLTDAANNKVLATGKVVIQ